MSPNPEDRLDGTNALEFEPLGKSTKPKRHWMRRLSFPVLVIIGSAGSWYYLGDQLSLMAPEEPIPIIRADITPIKIKPADPGGAEVPYQGTCVYERLNGKEVCAKVEQLLPPPEKLMPIPESQLQPKSTKLEPEQRLIADYTSPKFDEPEQQTEKIIEREQKQVNASNQNGSMHLQAPSELPKATQDVLMTPPTPVEPFEPIKVYPVTETSTPTALEPSPQEELVSADTHTPDPTLTVTKRAQAEVKSQAESSANTATTKEYRIQLAALRSYDRAEVEWNRQSKEHSDILGNLQLFVVKVDLGGDKGIFYRLRAGPLRDSVEAKKLCEQLTKRNLGCLVIRPGK